MARFISFAVLSLSKGALAWHMVQYGVICVTKCQGKVKQGILKGLKTVSAAFHFAHSGTDCLDSCIKKEKKWFREAISKHIGKMSQIATSLFLSKIQLHSKLIMFMNIDSIQSEHVCVMCTRVVHIIMVSEVHGSIHSMYLLHRCFKPHLVM